MTDKRLTPVWVVIPAAGMGQRMQTDLPKQYLKIHDKTLIEHTIDCFINHENIAGVVIVLNSNDNFWNTLNFNSKSVISTKVAVVGKSERSDSVLHGLKYLKNELNIPTDSWVMVHDAARPCVSKSDLDALLALREVDSIGGILASPVRDTMKRSVIEDKNINTIVSHTESRENLWHALTPQMFRLDELSKALLHSDQQNKTVTDECSAMENIGANPQIVEGSHNNIKVTYPSDIELATFLIIKKTQEAHK